MTQDRFQVCLAELAKVEGGWSNHPHDKGGATMAGVTQKTYDAWRQRKGLPQHSVRNSTPAERTALYRDDFWNAVRGDELPAGVDLLVFEHGVNSGPGISTRTLQRCLGVPADGHMGARTIEAAQRADARELVVKYMAARRAHFRSLSDYRHFGRGWERRANYMEPTALAMTGAVVPVTHAQPLSDPDEQSASQGRAVENKPASSAAVAAGAGAAASGAATVVNQTISAPPPALTETVTNIGLWQQLGRQCAEFGRFIVTNPIEVGVIAACVVAVWLAPRFLPVIWSRQT